MTPLLLPNPPAGQDFILTVPANERYRLLSIHATLTTDATASSRAVWLHILTPNGTTIAAVHSGGSQAASTSRIYQWLPFAPLAVSPYGATLAPLPAPPFELLPGWQARPLTAFLSAGDQWSNIAISVQSV